LIEHALSFLPFSEKAVYTPTDCLYKGMERRTPVGLQKNIFDFSFVQTRLLFLQDLWS
jgi:hypothetical protein